MMHRKSITMLQGSVNELQIETWEKCQEEGVSNESEWLKRKKKWGNDITTRICETKVISSRGRDIQSQVPVCERHKGVTGKSEMNFQTEAWLATWMKTWLLKWNLEPNAASFSWRQFLRVMVFTHDFSLLIHNLCCFNSWISSMVTDVFD